MKSVHHAFYLIQCWWGIYGCQSPMSQSILFGDLFLLIKTQSGQDIVKPVILVAVNFDIRVVRQNYFGAFKFSILSRLTIIQLLLLL